MRTQLPLLVVCACIGGCRPARTALARDSLPSNVRVVDEDTAFARARAQAQATIDSLGRYLERKPSPVNASVKMPIKTSATSDDNEHLWFVVLRGTRHVAIGWLENHPLDSSLVRYHDTLSLSLSEATDWEYTDSLGEHGGYTTALWERLEATKALDSPSVRTTSRP